MDRLLTWCADACSGALASRPRRALAACGWQQRHTATDDSASDRVSPSPGPWFRTDDLGQEVELDRTPVRIAAYGDAASGGTSGSPRRDFHLDRWPRTPCSTVSTSPRPRWSGRPHGEIDLEQLAPRSWTWSATSCTTGTPRTRYGFGTRPSSKVSKIAPVVAVAQVGSMADVIATNEEPVSLGGHRRRQSGRQDRAAFEQASRDLGALPGATCPSCRSTPTPTALYVAKAPDDPQLAYYQDLGVDFTEIGGGLLPGLENADRYDPDIFTQRDPQLLLHRAAREQPTFARLAPTAPVRSTRGRRSDGPRPQTAAMQDLAGWLRDDQDLTG